MAGKMLMPGGLAFALMAVISASGLSQTKSATEINSACPQCQPAALTTLCNNTHPLVGAWTREIDGTVIVATLRGDELKLCISQKTGEAVQCLTFFADCTVTRDGLVHGVITGVDVAITSETNISSTPTLSKKLISLQDLVDYPFSFRTRLTSGGLMVSHVKFAMEDVDLKEIVCQFSGMYKQMTTGVGNPKLQEVPVELGKK